MKIFHAAAKLDAGADKKHGINFHWPKLNMLYDLFWPSTLYTKHFTLLW